MNDAVELIIELFERCGSHRYDEVLSQVAHAEQCAQMASSAGAPNSLVAAALLHDVGHLVAIDRGDVEPNSDSDLRHEALGARLLAPIFGPVVAAPVALHVAAKRYLVAVDSDYELSDGSRASLARQGGPMDADERQRFEEQPGHRDAVSLRRWDDAAKVLDLEVPRLASYALLLRDLVVDAGAEFEA